jgi:hypothetical protein
MPINGKFKLAFIIIVIIFAILFILLLIVAKLSADTIDNTIKGRRSVIQRFTQTNLIDVDTLNADTDIYIGTTQVVTVPRNSPVGSAGPQPQLAPGEYYGILRLIIPLDDPRPIGSVIKIHNISTLPQNTIARYGNIIAITPATGVTLDDSAPVAYGGSVVPPTKTAMLLKIERNRYLRLT